jgi:glycosyltransferase involved in cell wall biosynthesis
MVSIIIPTYNRASLLDEAIRSVLSQTYLQTPHESAPFEIIVVDDGSEDRTRDVVDGFGGKVVYHYRDHGGVSSARNEGLQRAGGDYIAFLDSDDLWMKDKLRIQMSYMKAFPRSMVCCTEEIWVRNGVRVNPRRKHRKHSGWIFDKVLPLCLLSLSSALFRRELFSTVGGFDERLPVCEDYDLSIRIAQRFPIHLIPVPLIIKRGGHPDQLSRKYWGMDRFRVRALEKSLSLNLTSEQRALVKQEIVRKCLILVQGFEKRGKSEEAAPYKRMIADFGLGMSIIRNRNL